jgi:hypothetical protein
MTGRSVTRVLLDFFGTLVSYSPSRTEQGYPQAHALACDMGARVDYPGFLGARAQEAARPDERSAADDSEFSMTKAAPAVLVRLAGRAPSAAGRHGDRPLPGGCRHLGRGGLAQAAPRHLRRRLRRLQADPARAAFVGDTYDADYARTLGRQPGPAAAPSGRHLRLPYRDPPRRPAARQVTRVSLTSRRHRLGGGPRPA